MTGVWGADKPAAFREMRAQDYPFTIKLSDVETGTGLWETTVEGPGVVEIPGREEANGGRPVLCQVIFPWGCQLTIDGPGGGDPVPG